MFLAAALVTACSSPGTRSRPGEAPWTSGRISVRVEASPDRGAQGVSANFELQGDGNRGELRLMSPLGSRLAAARWSPGVAVLTTPQGEQDYATLDDLSRQALGESLPLAALPDWLNGRPWAGAPHALNDAGFDQLGWLVMLAHRAEGLIEARRAAPPTVLVRVRIDNDAP